MNNIIKHFKSFTLLQKIFLIILSTLSSCGIVSLIYNEPFLIIIPIIIFIMYKHPKNKLNNNL